MFVNFSNHPSDRWSEEQLAAAREFGCDVYDMPFPSVDPHATCDAIQVMARVYVRRIVSAAPCVVLCQGEYTLAFAVAMGLMRLGITVVAACSKRCVREYYDNGTVNKLVKYRFIQFRDYLPH